MTEFWGLDTETDNNEEGGQAVLITIWGPSGGEGLRLPKTFNEIWKFIKGRQYVAFNADFDIQAMLHDTFIPYRKLKHLARFKLVSYRGWVFKFIPTKFLTITKGGETCTIYDLQQFYGTSLAAAATKYLSITKKDIPKTWYKFMKKYLENGGTRQRIIIQYALRDAEIAYALCLKLSTSFRAVGLNPKKLISPASLTMEFFGPQLKKEPEVSNQLNHIWKQGFYGGRVEIGSLGTTGPVSMYDIHSAYPSEIAELTTLTNCSLTIGEKPHPLRSVIYGLYRGTVYVPLDWKWGPLAVRDGGKVIYPVGAVSTWFCKPAREELEALGLKIQYQECYEYVGKPGPKIFHGIDELYRSRRDPVLSLAAKLMLNSLYGKLCEARRERVANGADSYRSYRVFGNYTNYVLASHITERTRMRVFRVLHKLKDRAYMAATDSVLIDRGVSVDKIMSIGEDMGQWDLKGHYEKSTVLACGRYFLFKAGNEVEGYLRGFQGTRRHFDKIRSTKRAYVKIPILQNLSMLQWANSGSSDDLNVLKDVKKELRCEDDKRFWPVRFKKIKEAFERKLSSQPWIVGDTRNLLKFKNGGVVA